MWEMKKKVAMMRGGDWTGHSAASTGQAFQAWAGGAGGKR